MKKRIKIGDQIFKIKLIDRYSSENLGSIVHDRNTIYIDSDLGKEDRSEVLFHEIAHRCIRNMECSEKSFFKRWKFARLNQDEIFINQLGRVLKLTFKKLI